MGLQNEEPVLCVGAAVLLAMPVADTVGLAAPLASAVAVREAVPCALPVAPAKAEAPALAAADREAATLPVVWLHCVAEAEALPCPVAVRSADRAALTVRVGVAGGVAGERWWQWAGRHWLLAGRHCQWGTAWAQ